MHRNPFPLLRTLAVGAVTALVVACAEQAGPTSLAELGADVRGDSASGAECDLVVNGTIRRWSGVVDSTGDTLGTREPLPGARVRLFFVAPLPRDSVPPDTIPNDTIPNDTTSPPDSSGGWDTLWVRSALALRAPADTSGGNGGGNGGRPDTTRGPAGQPDAQGTARGDGSYSIEGVCPGIYRVEILEPGTGRSIFTFVAVRDPVTTLNFTFAPRRR